MHGEPHTCLKPLVDKIHAMLNQVLVRSAQKITLIEQGHGMSNAVIDPAEMRDFTAVVLGVNVAMPPDVLQQGFQTQAKAGPYVAIFLALVCKRWRSHRARSLTTRAICISNSLRTARFGKRWRATAGLPCMSSATSRNSTCSCGAYADKGDLS